MKLTDKQRAIHSLKQEGVSNREIGRRMGISESAIRGHLKRINVKLEREGADPERFAPGATTLVGADGEIRLQWVRTEKGRAELEDVATDILEGINAVAGPSSRGKLAQQRSRLLVPIRALAELLEDHQAVELASGVGGA